MNKLMCANGHFYDGDMYSTCPHCESGMEAAKPDPFLMKHHHEYPSVSENSVKEKKGFFHRKKDEDDSHTEILTPEDIDDNNEKTEILLEEEEISVEKPEEAKSVELSFNAAYKKAMSEPDIPKEPVIMKPIATPAINDLDEGKTIGFFSTGKTEPPVGYLICVKGEDYGTGFALKTGNNSIGRSQSMDVVILDAKVSREKQAFVMYEPHNRDFYLKPGEGTGLCYLNGDILLEIKKLKAYDRISLGDSELLLVPVCGEQFSWE